MLVLKMTGGVCEVRQNMFDAGIHACRSVVSTLRLLQLLMSSLTTSTCLVAMVMSLQYSYCLKDVQYMSHVIHLSQILKA